MARRNQQIDASNFVYSIDRKIAPFLKITASKRALHGFGYANLPKRGVRIPPVRGKQWLASMESSVNFRAKKARKRLMPLAFRQWHLYRFDFMPEPERFELLFLISSFQPVFPLPCLFLVQPVRIYYRTLQYQASDSHILSKTFFYPLSSVFSISKFLFYILTDIPL